MTVSGGTRTCRCRCGTDEKGGMWKPILTAFVGSARESVDAGGAESDSERVWASAVRLSTSPASQLQAFTVVDKVGAGRVSAVVHIQSETSAWVSDLTESARPYMSPHPSACIGYITVGTYPHVAEG